MLGKTSKFSINLVSEWEIEKYFPPCVNNNLYYRRISEILQVHFQTGAIKQVVIFLKDLAFNS